MAQRKSISSDWPFTLLIHLILILGALSCLLPMVHVLALSFSEKAAATAGWVGLWPIGFNLESYRMLAVKTEFWRGFVISFFRLALGIPINMILCLLVAYPLSQENRVFRARTTYVWLLAFTMFFSGGLIPSYILTKELGLLNTIWALVLPGAVPVYNSILLLNFFRSVPRELSESAFVDGADHLTILAKLYLPVSKPALATILLYTFLGHWNAWLDGIIYMNDPSRYPLQSYLQVMINSVDYITKNESVLDPEKYKQLAKISNQTFRAAQIFLGALPVMLIYPFLQKYFVKGLIIGSVKG